MSTQQSHSEICSWSRLQRSLWLSHLHHQLFQEVSWGQGLQSGFWQPHCPERAESGTKQMEPVGPQPPLYQGLLCPKSWRTGSLCACCPSAGETAGPAQESLSSWQGCPKLRKSPPAPAGFAQPHFHQCSCVSGDLWGQAAAAEPLPSPWGCTSASGSASPGISLLPHRSWCTLSTWSTLPTSKQ